MKLFRVLALTAATATMAGGIAMDGMATEASQSPNEAFKAQLLTLYALGAELGYDGGLDASDNHFMVYETTAFDEVDTLPEENEVVTVAVDERYPLIIENEPDEFLDTDKYVIITGEDVPDTCVLAEVAGETEETSHEHVWAQVMETSFEWVVDTEATETQEETGHFEPAVVVAGYECTCGATK